MTTAFEQKTSAGPGLRAAAMVLALALLSGSLSACGSDPASQTSPSANYSTPADGLAVPARPPSATVAPGAAATRSSETPDAASPGQVAPKACSAELGAKAADNLVAQCRAVSPATHPPCNVANSCAMIRDEITRGCGLLDRAEAGKLPACARASDTVEPATAAATVQRYYAAIAARDYQRAYRLWDRAGAASGKSFDQFRRGFADTASTRVELGTPRAPEGAAGTTYVTVPVTVTAVAAAGTERHFAGEYVLRRTNDVPGASAEDRRWRIASASLKPHS